MKTLALNFKQLFSLILLLSFILLIREASAQNNAETKHPKVYQTNLINKYIDKSGYPLLYKTSLSNIFRATYYKYNNSDNFIEATTEYRVVESTPINVFYRHNKNSNSFVQVIYSDNGAMSSESFTLNHNQTKEVSDGGQVYGLYRYGDFLKLLYIKGMNGELWYQL